MCLACVLARKVDCGSAPVWGTGRHVLVYNQTFFSWQSTDMDDAAYFEYYKVEDSHGLRNLCSVSRCTLHTPAYSGENTASCQADAPLYRSRDIFISGTKLKVNRGLHMREQVCVRCYADGNDENYGQSLLEIEVDEDLVWVELILWGLGTVAFLGFLLWIFATVIVGPVCIVIGSALLTIGLIDEASTHTIIGQMILMFGFFLVSPVFFLLDFEAKLVFFGTLFAVLAAFTTATFFTLSGMMYGVIVLVEESLGISSIIAELSSWTRAIEEWLLSFASTSPAPAI